ncbi:WASH complex subunit 4 [Toxorhynchites rutilus septentrionalis]|uniref:WASH complex subunit 4 n=1 Tax=Toxorhynchites rutilus septentrionalis TaxID=329112 RepID=UPI0024797468|nr:WASH complex subunit 4 [Toxorhynchites rutilus septentrionalis]
MHRNQQNLNYYGATQIKEFGLFLEEYDLQLQRIGHKIYAREVAFPTVSIRIDCSKEDIGCMQLIDTDNKILNKILYSFSALCQEVDCLKEEFDGCLQEFLCFDEALDRNTEQLREESTVTVSRSSLLAISDKFELFTRIKCYFERIVEVAVIIVLQLGALFDDANKISQFNHSNWEMDPMFNCLADLVLLPLLFDEILRSSTFQTYWKFYVKQIRSLKINSNKLGKPLGTEQITDLNKALDEISIWFDENAYKHILEALFNAKQKVVLESATLLSEKFVRYLRHRLSEAASYNAYSSCNDEVANVIKLNAMVNLYHYIFVSIDGKILKGLLDVNEKFCGAPIIGKVVWVPDEFFRRYGHKTIRDCDRNNYQKARELYQARRKKTLTKDIFIYCVQISSWLVRASAAFKTTKSDTTLETLRQKCELIFEGVHYCQEISFLVQSITSLHVYMDESISTQLFQCVGKLIEYLQCLSNFFDSHQQAIAETNQFVIQHLQHKICVIVGHSKKKIIYEAKQAKLKKSEAIVDKLSAFHVIERCVSGPANRTRLAIASLAFSITDPRQTMTPESYEKIRVLLDQLNTLSNLQSKLRRLCDTKILFWHSSFFAHYVADYYEQNLSQNNIKYIAQSASTCCDTLRKISSDKGTLNVVVKLEKQQKKFFNDNLIDQISNHIESYIRLDYYGKTAQIEPVNPFNDSALKLSNIHSLVHVEPFLVGSQYHYVKEYVKNHLSCTYYALASISQHDWKIYKEMRCQAATYKIDTIEDQLPKQTLEQGLDVLEIMHNIEHFVSHYVYNLNFQIFIEQFSSNNFLNTVNIEHIANSLRRHGSGIINTTVNYTFQFLRQKFFAFSHFLYDEQIKARLTSDAKYFLENADALNQTYDYNRAHQFNRKIKNLGLSDTGETYMDLFRKLISHIGNAIGYIRMIRSGALHECTEAKVYLPIIDEELNFANYAKEEELHEMTVSAAEILELDINSLCQNYRIDTNYFRLLVNAFLNLRHAENIHLQTFYMIIPPLTINFVEYILKAKEKLAKRDKMGALFTDDGFAMGIAYILKLLDQTSKFNSLHWFRSVKNKYTKEIEKLDTQHQQTNDGDKLLQTFALTRRRLNMVQQEFDLLFCNLSSAKVFFNDAVD